MRKWYQALSHRQTVAVLLVLLVAAFSLSLPVSADDIALQQDALARALNFNESQLNGTSSEMATSLEFGPDGRLYVAEIDGTIKAYTINRVSSTNYQVTATETIELIKNMPNYNDDGSLYTGGTIARQVTGHTVVEENGQPVIYVTSSDFRTAIGNDTGLDTNSGVISRLAKVGGNWQKVDLVRGLPRSEEYHSINGLYYDQAANMLYVTIGGNTNKGAPSTNFALTPEYALSAAMLSVNMNMINAMSPKTDSQGQVYLYNLPTLDDPTRGTPGQPDPGDPFGGNDGRNQAMLVQGGPVQIHAGGLRNAYSIIRTEAGRMYTFDNGPNGDWGGTPVGNGTNACTNERNEDDSSTQSDNLHLITGPGYYAGHPTPVRGNPDGAGLYQYDGGGNVIVSYDFTEDWTPVPFDMADPRECTYLVPGTSDGALHTLNSSINGLVEYTSNALGGALKGNLLATAYNDNIVWRFVMNNDGTDVLSATHLFSGFNGGNALLDIATQGDNEIFPGTIWTASLLSGAIHIFEPVALVSCSGADNASLDEDGDLYTNADEIDNGTDPCSAGSKPSDFDGDFVSDLNDFDDDADGVDDVADSFAQDATNGLNTTLPLFYPMFNTTPGTGFFGLGFTGLMNNNVTNYLTQYSIDNLAPGGAGGVFTIENVPAGDPIQGANNAQYGFQFGLNASQETEPFAVRVGLNAPYFDGETPVGSQSLGFYIGNGDQDNYLKMVLTANGGVGGIEVLGEVNQNVTTQAVYGPASVGNLLGTNKIELILVVNPNTNTVQPKLSVNSTGIEIPVGGPVSIPDIWLNNPAKGMAIGVIATSFGGPSFAANWDYIRVEEAENTEPNPNPGRAVLDVDMFENTIDNSTYAWGSFKLFNTANTGGPSITNVTIDLSTTFLPDIVFDPNGTAGDKAGKDFENNQDNGAGFSGPRVFGKEHQGGFQTLSLNFNSFGPGDSFLFSIDVDPTSIKDDNFDPGKEAGGVTGLELTGATFTVTFSDGSTYSGQMFRKGSTNDGGIATVTNTNASIAQPAMSVVGIPTTPRVVNNPNQTIRVTGPAGATVKLLHTEAALWLPESGAYTNVGFDIDPFEANSVVAIHGNSSGQTIPGNGQLDIPVVLTRTNFGGTQWGGDCRNVGQATGDGNDCTGYNYIMAVIESNGITGPVSKIVLEYDPEATSTNNPPVAANDSYEVVTGGTLNISAPGVLDNDIDPDGDAMQAVLVDNPTHAASFTLNLNGSFDYTPANGFIGTDTFTYRARDPQGELSMLATVTITVNAAPSVVANDDSYSTDEDVALNIAAPGVLGNDTEPNSQPLETVLITDVQNGVLTLNPDGSFIYTPAAEFSGTDTFVYRAKNGEGGPESRDDATVTITVSPVNDAPVAVDDSYTVIVDNTLTIAAPGVLGNDSEPESETMLATLVSGPTNAQSFNLSPNGSFTYTPNAGFTGTDTFTYTARDPQDLLSEQATVTINVTALTSVVANDDSYSTNEDVPLNIAAPGVLANDLEPNNQPLEVVIWEGPQNGVLTLNPDGSFVYTPNLEFSGIDTFEYRAKNGEGGADSRDNAIVTITVNPVNDLPVAVNDAYGTPADTPLTIPAPGVLANDSDVDSPALTAQLNAAPDAAAGSLILNPDGSFTFTPVTGFEGDASFSYVASDGENVSNIGTVTITVGIPENLLLNPSMEIEGVSKAELVEWRSVRTQLRDRRVCNVVNVPGRPDRIRAYEGECAYRFRNTDSTVPSRRIQQNVNDEAVVSIIQPGDIVTLSGQFRANNLSQRGFLYIIVVHTDGTREVRKRSINPGSYGYTLRAKDVEIDKPVLRIKVSVRLPAGTTGTVHVDALSLTLTKAGTAPLELPSAAEEVREAPVTQAPTLPGDVIELPDPTTSE